MSFKVFSIFLLCTGALFSCTAEADSVSCIVSGSTVRDAAASAMSAEAISLDTVACAQISSLAVSELDSVTADSEASAGVNLNSLSVGFMFIFR